MVIRASEPFQTILMVKFEIIGYTESKFYLLDIVALWLSQSPNISVGIDIFFSSSN